RGGGQTHANRGRTPAGSLLLDAVRLSGLRGYALWRSVDLGEAARAAVRSPDKAEGRIRGGRRMPIAGERLPEACSRMRFAYPGYGAARSWRSADLGEAARPRFVARIRPKAASGGAHAN